MTRRWLQIWRRKERAIKKACPDGNGGTLGLYAELMPLGPTCIGLHCPLRSSVRASLPISLFEAKAARNSKIRAGERPWRWWNRAVDAASETAHAKHTERRGPRKPGHQRGSVVQCSTHTRMARYTHTHTRLCQTRHL